jgi:hypothetical protein
MRGLALGQAEFPRAPRALGQSGPPGLPGALAFARESCRREIAVGPRRWGRLGRVRGREGADLGLATVWSRLRSRAASSRPPTSCRRLRVRNGDGHAGGSLPRPAGRYARFWEWNNVIQVTSAPELTAGSGPRAVDLGQFREEFSGAVLVGRRAPGGPLGPSDGSTEVVRKFFSGPGLVGRRGGNPSHLRRPQQAGWDGPGGPGPGAELGPLPI